ncbi:uncharacterized protein Dmoj_GI13280, isoform F [Drosophila mojavensis]|uniref:Uncharacterized protein, isoform B n=1 Tax=Drosophila mojavensis TaxID=7230 RepID=A0A0Q9XLP8_DROMO|nr:uncharacterized protein Dmoj_GI13280, isoform B [Drosophila mojavensis]KRG06226.1 uncharacterized protein Dmoj_GI13280, isoform C [Drosophila mojavensis]KRG06227.1 uncharacterized protein Dmoj_GI13280, isoform D [Drosophila mojavensis]KRG06228.1 uncharacterized protein Dmoj_GI13280, isoform F [Drosophila mojavensis]
MSVIIRLQNLPWTANARDIRNFFTGLSIPEGGVHIIGGEMGDAFIAFSTDEDARCAMLKDREKLMEIQVRLLLSSRAEMQKVIETARNVSAAAVATPTPTPMPMPTPKPVAASVAAVAMPPVPQPPIIGGLNSFLLGQQQGQQGQQLKQQLASVAASASATPSFLAYQQQAGISLADVGGLKAAVDKPAAADLGLFRRSRSRSSSSDDSDRSHDRGLRDRGRKRRSELRSDSSERELKVLPKPQTLSTGAVSNLSPWALGATVPPTAAATIATAGAAAVSPGLNAMPGLQQQLGMMNVLPPVLQSYSTTSNVTTNNYNLNLSAATQQQQQQQQLLPQQQLAKPQSQQLPQEPIAFANVNPYAQMYPQLFQQQQLLLQQQAAKNAAGNSPGQAASAAGGVGASASGTGAGGGAAGSSAPIVIAETCYIKISGMCPSTSYSDLRKYFAGLYIPHNGIKIVSGPNGTRTGVAYIEFSRVSSAQKALLRNNTLFRDRLVQIVPISDEEFEQVDERSHRGNSNSHSSSSPAERSTAAPGTLPPISVLYVEDLPQLTTEQDIMKMFSATYTIVDILLAPSPNNRREFVAFVLFARENEARSALEDTSRHYIGFRKLRVRASSQAEMQNARDKMRRASEQLQKEEQQQREEAEREQQQNNGMNNYGNGMHMMNNNHNNNMGPFGMLQNNFNSNHPMHQQHQQQQQQQQQQRRPEDVFVRVHNCEYATRINDLGELFVSENLRIEHIEMLFNDRNQSAGEFIVEFADAVNAKRAIREFHNRRFRGRGLRLTSITPQEIADRMNKPFMDYLPGGNGPRQLDPVAPLSPPMQQQQPQQSRRRGPSRFDDASNCQPQQQQQQSQQQPDSDDSSNVKQHFNPFAVRGGPELGSNEVPVSPPIIAPAINANNGSSEPEENGIPDKFNRAGCVVAMRNVPFKADLKDILRFFSDYKLSPDDIIRRFNDEGKPTGDARVAFESPAEARSAFESRRRKQIFNRTVYLDII